MSIYYTGKGDRGTSHVGRKKLEKTCNEIAALGDLDELNSLLGVVKNLPTTSWSAPSLLSRGNKKSISRIIASPYQGEVSEGGRGGKLFKILETIQQDLFIIQAHVAAFWFEKEYKPPNFSPASPKTSNRGGHEKVQMLEKIIAQYEKKLSPLKKFVVPGATEYSAWLDYARAVARRTERSVLLHTKNHTVAPEILSYLNRLSSLFFVLARVAALDSKKKEQNPHYK